MPYSILENVDIKKYSSFRMGGTVKYFVEITDTSDLPLLVKEAKSPIYILGEGCNTIFNDSKILPYFIIHMKNIEIEKLSENTFKVQAGHSWDDFVKYSVECGYSGIEALSAIPGSVGASPVQNIGAYGQEVCGTIIQVHVFDLKESIFKTLSNRECGFGYRTSIFKTTEKNRYIITAVTFKLSKNPPSTLNYPDLKNYFKKTPTLSEIRDAIISIRSKKLPDPKNTPNVGSYFENIIVDETTISRLKINFPNIPIYNSFKIPTGWLIDQCGLKGKSFGPIKISENNALVLTHDGTGTYSDLYYAEKFISDEVYKKFGLKIAREANILS